MQLDPNGPLPIAELAAVTILRPAAACGILDRLAGRAPGARGRAAVARRSADGETVIGEVPTG